MKIFSDFGRPRNGMFIATPRDFIADIEDVSPDFWRLQAITLKTSSTKILLVNSYFPIDSRFNFDETELLETLHFIRKLLHETSYDHLLWAGDINADFLRQSGHTVMIDQFLTECSLNKSWQTFNIDFTHMTEINGVSHTSTIDHFFWSKSLESNVVNSGIFHHPSNMSDHSPVFCCLTLKVCPPMNHLCLLLM